MNRRGHSVKVGYARNQMSTSKIIVNIIYPHFVSALTELAPAPHELFKIFVRLTYEKRLDFFSGIMYN